MDALFDQAVRTAYLMFAEGEIPVNIHLLYKGDTLDYNIAMNIHDSIIWQIYKH